jgi:hypothetical protein
LLEARTTDGLKAAEMLAKMCGWNEPEKSAVQHVHLQVDASLIAQLRTGYAEMSGAKLIGAPFELMGPDTPGTQGPPVPPPTTG